MENNKQQAISGDGQGLTDRVAKAMRDAVAAAGFELWGFDYDGTLLTVYIDKSTASSDDSIATVVTAAGVTIADCELATRQLRGVLTVIGWLTEKHRLEVSSPGIDRPLFKLSQCERYRGEWVKIKCYEPIDGQRAFKGAIDSVTDDGVNIVVDDKGTVHIPWGQVHRARLMSKIVSLKK